MATFRGDGHLSDAALGLYALKDLPRMRSARVEAHVVRCERCRSEFREVEELVALLRTIAAAGPRYAAAA